MFYLKLLLIIFSFNVVFSAEDSFFHKVKTDLQHIFTDAVTKQPNVDYKKMLAQQYELIGLRTKQQWVITALSEYSAKLIPDDLNQQTYNTFLSQLLSSNYSNPHFKTLLVNFYQRHNALPGKEKESLIEQIPFILSYGMALNKLVELCRVHPTILEGCMQRFEQHNNMQTFGWTGYVKYISVYYPLKKILYGLKSHNIRRKDFHFILPLNIMEASIYDYWRGYTTNATRGYNVAFFRDSWETSLQESQNRGKVICLGNSKNWSDGYQRWNAEFVSSLSFYPYAWMKLAIPAVSMYKDTPGFYMHNRIIALYFHLHFLAGIKNAPSLKTAQKFAYFQNGSDFFRTLFE